jgi:hypothetical protein
MATRLSAVVAPRQSGSKAESHGRDASTYQTSMGPDGSERQRSYHSIAVAEAIYTSMISEGNGTVVSVPSLAIRAQVGVR